MRVFLLIVALSGLILSSLFLFQDRDEVISLSIIIRNHVFEPNELSVVAGQKIKLVLINEDDSPEEFESNELNREKVIEGNSRASIFIGPLEPGRYPFYGEFNPKTAQGVIIVE